jgi:hypothetical protein
LPQDDDCFARPSHPPLRDQRLIAPTQFRPASADHFALTRGPFCAPIQGPYCGLIWHWTVQRRAQRLLDRTCFSGPNTEHRESRLISSLSQDAIMSGIVTLAIFISAVCAGSPLFSLRTGPETIIYGVSSSTTSTLCSPSSSPSPARSSPVRISPEALEDRHLFDVRVLRLDRAGLANDICGYDRWNWRRRRSRCGFAKPCNISRNAEVSRHQWLVTAVRCGKECAGYCCPRGIL